MPKGFYPDSPDTLEKADNGRGGVTLKQVGEDLGISAHLLGRWRRLLAEDGAQAFPGHGYARDEELMQLKRELARVKKERDFLKEAAAFFARTST